jgi:hypothetical protein
LQALIFLAIATAPELPDGTLLFVENGYNIVERFTDSSYSHVAIVVDGQVYEANPPKVIKYSVEDWFTNIGKNNEGIGSPAIVEALLPNTPYSEAELKAMREYLEKQVGRRYSVKGYLKKHAGDGIHCAEMCSAALETTGRINFESENCRFSPGTLRETVESSYHRDGMKLYVSTKKEHRRNVTERLKDYWARQTTMCKWSCIETMLYCW